MASYSRGDDGVLVYSNHLNENQLKAAILQSSRIESTLNGEGDRDETNERLMLYTITWLAKPEYENPLFPGLTEPRWHQFTGTAREVYATIQWVKAQIERGIVLDVKVERLIRDRSAAMENGWHWHTVNGTPEFHSWDDCPENLEDWLDYKDE